jgi:hypothetical protein
MGNAQSDAGERDAWDIIKLIPIVNLAYGLPRMVVHAAKGNGGDVIKTAVGIPGSIVTAGAFAIGGPGMGAVAGTMTGVFSAAAGKGYDIASRNSDRLDA